MPHDHHVMLLVSDVFVNQLANWPIDQPIRQIMEANKDPSLASFLQASSERQGRIVPHLFLYEKSKSPKVII